MESLSMVFMPTTLTLPPNTSHQSPSNSTNMASVQQVCSPAPPPPPPFCTNKHCILPPSPTPQQQALLDQLALELSRERPSRGKLRRRGKSWDPIVRALASILCDIQQLSQVDAFLDGIQLSAHVFAALFQQLGRRNKPCAIVCVYEWLRGRPSSEERLNVYVYSSALAALLACGDFEWFHISLAEMEQLQIEPNLVTYNIIIQAYERQGLHPKAMEAFHQLVQKGIEPNRATFRGLLSAFDTSVDFRGAFSLYSSLKDMLLKVGMEHPAKELKESISSFCCGIICRSLRAGKGPDSVIRLVEIAEANLSELRVRDYEEIIWTCGFQKGDHAIAKHVLACRRKCSVPLGTPLCNHVMQVMRKEKKWWAGLEVFETMVEHGPPPDAESYEIMKGQFNFLLNASEARGTSSWSVQLLDKMEAHDIHPDMFAFKMTLLACVKKVDAVSAVKVFQKMIDHGMHPSIVCYGALLTTLEKSQLFEEAEKVWAHMRNLGVKPNIKIFNIMISVYGALQKHGDVRRILDEMLTSGVGVSLITYNNLITNCAKMGDADGALEWMKELTAKGQQPNAVTYSQLVLALCRAGRAELARNMCIEAHQLQLSLSRASYVAIVEACNVHEIQYDLEEMGASFLFQSPINSSSDVVKPNSETVEEDLSSVKSELDIFEQ